MREQGPDRPSSGQGAAGGVPAADERFPFSGWVDFFKSMLISLPSSTTYSSPEVLGTSYFLGTGTTSAFSALAPALRANLAWAAAAPWKGDVRTATRAFPRGMPESW